MSKAVDWTDQRLNDHHSPSNLLQQEEGSIGGVDVECQPGVTELIRNPCNLALSCSTTMYYQHQPFKPIYTNQSVCQYSSVTSSAVAVPVITW